jgi:hypothetical protein
MELRKEMESIKAAAKAGSVISTAAPSIIGETGIPGARDINDTLTDRALMMRREETTREQTDSPAPSSIEKVTSDKPDSLTFSPSFSRSVGEVKRKLFKVTGHRCSADITKCDCHAYNRDSENREFFQALRVRKQIEKKMLGADMWSKRIRKLDDPNSTEPKAMTEAQLRWKDEEDTRRILDENQIPAFQTMDDEAEEIEVEENEVRQPATETPRVNLIEAQNPTIDSARVIPTESPIHNDAQPVEPVRTELEVVPPVPPVTTTVNNPDDEPMTVGEMRRKNCNYTRDNIKPHSYHLTLVT